jgi:RNA 3'-terminal phosphate cyclase
MGVDASLEVIRRGYYPRGGGEARIAVAPGALGPLVLDEPGAIVAIEGHAHVSNLPEHIATRMRDAALERLAGASVAPPRVEIEVSTGPEPREPAAGS